MTVQIIDNLIANLTMQRGDTPTWRIPIFESLDGVPTATPFDLTGYKIWMTAKRAWTDSDAQAVFQITSVAGQIVLVGPAADGLIDVTPLPTSTNGLVKDESLKYDIQIANATGTRVYTVRKGELLVELESTQVYS